MQIVRAGRIKSNASLARTSAKDRFRMLAAGPPHRQLRVDRLDAIMAHGDHTQSGRYFPSYLLKCLQDFLDRHGDDLDRELKHIRNALDVACGALRFVEKASVQSRQIKAFATAHRLLRAQASAPPDPNQLPLF